MLELWIPLQDIPAEGREFHFTDQSLWTGPMLEYGVQGRPGKPLSATLNVIPQGEGFFVNGQMRGSVFLPCDACVEDFEFEVVVDFDGYDQEPGADQGGETLPDETRIRMHAGSPELDAAGLLWEQFLLALPVRPLCAEGCKGLCPQCGANRNQGMCACVEDDGDPRLAVLRKLKLS